MPRDSLPLWVGEFARQALANALGTLIAALTLFLGGVLVGAIGDVPLGSIVAALGALVSLLVMTISAAVFTRRYPRYRDASGTSSERSRLPPKPMSLLTRRLT